MAKMRLLEVLVVLRSLSPPFSQLHVGLLARVFGGYF